MNSNDLFDGKNVLKVNNLERNYNFEILSAEASFVPSFFILTIAINAFVSLFPTYLSNIGPCTN